MPNLQDRSKAGDSETCTQGDPFRVRVNKEGGCPAPSGDRRAEAKEQGSGTGGQLPAVSRVEATEGRAFESKASTGLEIFASVTKGSAEKFWLVPGGLREPRRRQ